MSNKNNSSSSYNEMMKDQKYYTLINTNLNYLLDVYDIVVFNQIVHICNLERGYCSMRFMSKILNMSINRINKSISKLKSVGMIYYKANIVGGTNFFTLNVDTIKEIYDNCNNSKIEYRIQYCRELLSKLDNSVSSEDTGMVLEDVIIDTKNDVTVSSEDTGGVSCGDTGVSRGDTGVSRGDTGCVTARYTYKEDITNQYKKNNKNEKYNEDVIFQNFEKREIETIENCSMNNSFSLDDNSSNELELNETKINKIGTNDSSSLNDNSSNELELNKIKIENNNNSNENIFFPSLNETKENCNNDLSSYLIKLNDISTKANREVLMNNLNKDNKTIGTNEKETETGSLKCLNEDNSNSNEVISFSLNEGTKTKITGANDSSSSSLTDIPTEVISDVIRDNSNRNNRTINIETKESQNVCKVDDMINETYSNKDNKVFKQMNELTNSISTTNDNNNTDVLNNYSNEDCKVISVSEKEAETGSFECLNENNNNSNESISFSLNEGTKTKITGANDSSSFSLNDNSNKDISSKVNTDVSNNYSNKDNKGISTSEKEAETGSLECLIEDNSNSNEENILINKETTCQSATRETNSFDCAARPAPVTIINDFNCEMYLQQQLNKVCDIYDNNNLKWYERKENMGWVGNVTRKELLKRYTPSEVNVLIAPLFNAIDILIDDIDTNFNTNRIPNYQYN